MFVVSLAILASCSPLPEGIGSDHEIVVIADPLDWPKYERIIEETFEKEVVTPQVEKVFTVRKADPGEFDFYSKFKNLVLLASLDSGGETAKLIKRLLGPEAERSVLTGNNYTFVKKNLWAKGQIVMILTSRDDRVLIGKLEENSKAIFNIMEGYLNRRIEAWLYGKSEQKRLEKRLLEKYGWTLRIPNGYRLAEEVSEERFVWFQKSQPDRWLFVCWEDVDDSSFLSKDRCLRKREEVAAKFYQGDRVVGGYTSVEKTSFLKREAIKIEGLWENRNLMAGGPFRTYCFHDPNTRGFYMVDVALFAPGVPKEPYLRQLDIIAHTFRTTENGGRR